MAETHGPEGLRDFDFEPLVIVEGVVGYHPEWMVTEGLVTNDMLLGPIWVPKIVAEALQQANTYLMQATTGLNEALGSFDEPLQLYLLAGKRDYEANLAIVSAARAMGRRIADLPYERYKHPYYSLDVKNNCLNDTNAHMSGREVDVALVYANSGRLFGGRYCYGMHYNNEGEIPVSFPDVVRPAKAQKYGSRSLLLNAMAAAGFWRPSSRLPWHFVYVDAR